MMDDDVMSTRNFQLCLHCLPACLPAAYHLDKISLENLPNNATKVQLPVGLDTDTRRAYFDSPEILNPIGLLVMSGPVGPIGLLSSGLSSLSAKGDPNAGGEW